MIINAIKSPYAPIPAPSTPSSKMLMMEPWALPIQSKTLKEKPRRILNKFKKKRLVISFLPSGN